MTSVTVACNGLEEFHSGQMKNPSRPPVFATSNFPYSFYMKVYKAFIGKHSNQKSLGNKTIDCNCQIDTIKSNTKRTKMHSIISVREISPSFLKHGLALTSVKYVP